MYFINNAAFPITKCKPKYKAIQTNNWITNEIRASSAHLKKAFEDLKFMYTEQIFEEYKVLKGAYYVKLDLPKKTFKYTSSQIGSKRTEENLVYSRPYGKKRESMN